MWNMGESVKTYRLDVCDDDIFEFVPTSNDFLKVFTLGVISYGTNDMVALLNEGLDGPDGDEAAGTCNEDLGWSCDGGLTRRVSK